LTVKYASKIEAAEQRDHQAGADIAELFEPAKTLHKPPNVHATRQHNEPAQDRKRAAEIETAPENPHKGAERDQRRAPIISRLRVAFLFLSARPTMKVTGHRQDNSTTGTEQNPLAPVSNWIVQHNQASARSGRG
jgi:hypothetical protein